MRLYGRGRESRQSSDASSPRVLRILSLRWDIDIDKLNAELKQIVARENELRAQIDELIANL